MRKLTDADWDRVFVLRCMGKRGESIEARDLRFLERALQEDPERYKRLGDLAFDATRPWGVR